MALKESDVFPRIQEDPLWAAKELLGVELDKFQKECLEKIWFSPKRKVHIMTGNGIGKTFMDAVVALLWLFAWGPECTVIVTASTGRQVYGQFWAEVKERVRNAKADLGVEPLETRYILQDKWAMHAFATSREANFEGWHNTNVLVIGDESKGIPTEIHRGMERLLMGADEGKRVEVLSGSPPLAPIGEFCDIKLNPRKAEFWEFMHQSCWESPRVSNEWCEQQLKIYGEDSPFYQSMVMGEIPTGATDSLITLKDIEQAAYRDLPPGKPHHLGIDIANSPSGDETVIIARQGPKVTDMQCRKGQHTVWIAGEAKQYQDIDAIKLDNMPPGVADILISEGIEGIEPIDFGGNGYQPDMYADIATEMYIALAQRFQEGAIDIPDDPILKAQLVSVQRDYRMKGGHSVMCRKSKKRMRAEDNFPSPDRGDALALAFWEGGQVEPVLLWT